MNIKTQVEIFKESNLTIEDLLEYITTHITDYYITYNNLLLDQFILHKDKKMIFYTCKFPFLGGGLMDFNEFDINKLSIKFPIDQFEDVLENIKVLKNEI